MKSALLLVLSSLLSSHVNPFVGTDAHGHTFPGACAPFGIVQLSPDTDTIPQNVDGRYQPDVYYMRYNTEVGIGNQIPLWLLGFLY